MFLVVETLSVPLLLGVEFIQEHVKSIQIKQRTVTMMDGNDVPLVPSVLRKLEDRDGAPVLIDEAYVVPPISEVVVEVSTSLAGLVVVSPEQSRKLRRAHVYVSNSLVVFDATRMKTKLKIANFSKYRVVRLRRSSTCRRGMRRNYADQRVSHTLTYDER